MGINVDQLLADHEKCFAELLSCTDPFNTPDLAIRDELVPKILLAAEAE